MQTARRCSCIWLALFPHVPVYGVLAPTSEIDLSQDIIPCSVLPVVLDVIIHLQSITVLFASGAWSNEEIVPDKGGNSCSIT